MKKCISKKFIVLTAVVLLLFVTVGSTLAYIFTKTEPVENTFNPSRVACAVVENGSATENTDDILETGTKTDVKIKNTGDTDAYIRVAVVVNWMSADGTRVWATKPVAGDDYTIDLDLNNGWSPVGDYYYYGSAVAPCTHKDGDEHAGCMTSVLIRSCTSVPGRAPDGYYLSVEIVASAIQSKGMGANSAQEAWAKAQQQNG